jgi:hypothetical protein
MYSSTVIISVIESRTQRWVRHIAYQREERVLMGKLSERDHLET